VNALKPCPFSATAGVRKAGSVAVLCAALLGSLAGSAHAETDSRLASLVQEIRNQGCQGRTGSPALAVDPALSRAAEAVNRQRDLATAQREAGYRSVRVQAIQMGGHPSVASARSVLVAKYCDALLDRTFADLGVGGSIAKFTVLLARPFVRSLPNPQATRDRVLALVNEARSRGGRCGADVFAPTAPLRPEARLQAAAQSHANDMAERNYYSHRSLDGASPSDRIKAHAYPGRRTAENIAAGQQSAEEVVDGWLKSPGHCRNLLHPELTEIGVGVAVRPASEGGIYWVQNFGGGRR
jgi:uncharacterized protein YkwD